MCDDWQSEHSYGPRGSQIGAPPQEWWYYVGQYLHTCKCLSWQIWVKETKNQIYVKNVPQKNIMYSWHTKTCKRSKGYRFGVGFEMASPSYIAFSSLWLQTQQAGARLKGLLIYKVNSFSISVPARLCSHSLPLICVCIHRLHLHWMFFFHYFFPFNGLFKMLHSNTRTHF